MHDAPLCPGNVLRVALPWYEQASLRVSRQARAGSKYQRPWCPLQTLRATKWQRDAAGKPTPCTQLVWEGSVGDTARLGSQATERPDTWAPVQG